MRRAPRLSHEEGTAAPWAAAPPGAGSCRPRAGGAAGPGWGVGELCGPCSGAPCVRRSDAEAALRVAETGGAGCPGWAEGGAVEDEDEAPGPRGRGR